MYLVNILSVITSFDIHCQEVIKMTKHRNLGFFVEVNVIKKKHYPCPEKIHTELVHDCTFHISLETVMTVI